MLHDVSIVIPSFNGVGALEKTLENLLLYPVVPEIIVVDGGSSDGSQALARKLGVRVLEVENFGYGHNLNRGVEVANGWFVVLMNSDVILPFLTLKVMLHELEDFTVGAVGALPLQKDGKRQQSFGAFYFPNFLKFENPLGVNLLHGYCIATRRDVLQNVGGFDENFFFYNEEFDWCWRVAKVGFELLIVPEIATHFGGVSTPNNNNIFLEGRRGGMYLIDKHFPFWISEPTRRFMQLEAWLASLVVQNPEQKQVWQTLERMMKTKNYLQSPFKLSKRAEVKF